MSLASSSPAHSRFLEHCERALRIPSSSERGNEILANFLGNLLSERGFLVNLQQVTHSDDFLSKRQFNLIGILGDPLSERKIRKGLLLCCSLDTLPTVKSQISSEVAEIHVSDREISGLGSAGGKLEFLCMFEAAKKFVEKKLRNPVYLVGTCASHHGMLGAKYLIQSMAMNPLHVVVGAPTGLNLVTQHKNLKVQRLRFNYHVTERGTRGFNRKIVLRAKGRAAHGAYPGFGANALTALAEVLDISLQNGFEFKLTRFEGGGVVDVVPRWASAEVYLTAHQFEDFKRFFHEVIQGTLGGDSEVNDNKNDLPVTFEMELSGIGDTGICFLPEQLFEAIMTLIQQCRDIQHRLRKITDEEYDLPYPTFVLSGVEQGRNYTELLFALRDFPKTSSKNIENDLQSVFSRIEKDFPSFNLEKRSELNIPGLKLSPDEDFVGVCEKAMVQADLKPKIKQMSYATEAGLFVKKGYDAIVFGSGSIESLYTSKESNSMAKMSQAISFYEKLIENLCL